MGSSTNATPDLEGYDQWLANFLRSLSPEERLAGLAPEERLVGLKPEERLVGLKPEQIARVLTPEQFVLGLPVEALRALSPEYIATLPEETQYAVRARLGR